MNRETAKSAVVLGAAVMILVTFAPEAAVAPLKTLFSQFRMNNVSATPVLPLGSSETDGSTSSTPAKAR